MQSNGAPCGELWVSYEIELRKPRLQVGISGEDSGNTNMDHIILYTPGGDNSGIKPATPFGTLDKVIYPTTASTLGGCVTPTVLAASNFAPQARPTGNNFAGGINQMVGVTPNAVPNGAKGPSMASTYYFPPGVSRGNFMITYTAQYTTGGASWVGALGTLNCVGLNVMGANDISVFDNAVVPSGTSKQTIMIAFVTVLNANASFQIVGTNGAHATPEFAVLYVTQVPTVFN